MQKITNLEYIESITKTSLNVIKRQKIFIDGYETGDEALAFITGITGTIDEFLMELLESDTYIKITESLLQPEYDDLDKIARSKFLFQDELSKIIIETINNLKSIITEATTRDQATTIISTTFENFRQFSVFIGGIKNEQFLDFLNKKETEYVNLVNTVFPR